MTPAAVAAAAAAAAAVAAAAAATASPTRYERTLRNCARDLSDFAGCSEPGAAWDEARFREWAREHRSEATKQAGRFVARLLRDKAANQSVGYTARLHVAAWKAYGVRVEQSVRDDLSRLTREKWRPATLSRLSALGARKSDQFDLLETHWSALVEYLGGTAGEHFAEHCRAAQSSQPTSIACELGGEASWRQALRRRCGAARRAQATAPRDAGALRRWLIVTPVPERVACVRCPAAASAHVSSAFANAEKRSLFTAVFVADGKRSRASPVSSLASSRKTSSGCLF
jgi:hypothetical protein